VPLYSLGINITLQPVRVSSHSFPQTPMLKDTNNTLEVDCKPYMKIVIDASETCKKKQAKRKYTLMTYKQTRWEVDIFTKMANLI